MKLRMDERLSDDHPQRSAARHYGFTATAKAIGDVPLDPARFKAFLQEFYSPARMERLVYGDSPLLSLFGGKR